MRDAIGRGPFPTTGNVKADEWIRDARNYIHIVAGRCCTCLQKSKWRCRECLSLEANLLISRHDAIRYGSTFESELDRTRRAVLDQFLRRHTIRGDMLEVPGLRNLHKTKFLGAMASDGLLVIERRVTGKSGHYSLYYSLPNNKRKTTQKKPNA